METKIIHRHPLGNPKRKWKQDNFIISTFRASEKNIENPRDEAFYLLNAHIPCTRGDILLGKEKEFLQSWGLCLPSDI